MSFNLASVFLQAPQSIDLSVIAIIVSSLTAIILAFMVLITWRNIKENTKATYSQLLRGFHEDLTTRLNKNSVLKTREDCQRYANDYLNTVDEIAFLNINGKIPQGIAKYLGRFFAYGLNIIDWYDDMIQEDFLETAKKNWPNYFRYCEKYSIRLNPEDKLPKIMLDYNQLRDNESQ
ncbi:MAG: hypothetical protein OEM21_03855 [Nitrosopumilus sp.]|nr:hypothetical protein [Nitrosopumilus sp.]